MNGPQLAERIGVSYRQVDFWVSKGYLRPENETGSGIPREFSSSEIQVAVVMARLVAAGVRPSEAHLIARGDPAAIAKVQAAMAGALRLIGEAA